MPNAIAQIFRTGRVQSFEPGQSVFRSGDPVRMMYLVTGGQIALVRHTRAGTPLMLARVGPGGVLAEASAYSAVYHCDGTARGRSQLRMLPVARFLDHVHGATGPARAWAAQLARALQAARMQSEIRSLNTVAERLDAWLSDNEALPPRGQIQDLAHSLGVTREALYRELARRRG
ncbi:Crp/Fnr family transcriptional regulator [Actibacterium ureilyticum]|uniref:Crp/Fnr family transcriptional regulator n=1 Tax=Actibacterium ureilyticum TaxID=1590614 RepID=UPI0015959C3B|nr:Crp/Fnr family transcriptional regulator [Actibacterium ureilyticum]